MMMLCIKGIRRSHRVNNEPSMFSILFYLRPVLQILTTSLHHHKARETFERASDDGS